MRAAIVDRPGRVRVGDVPEPVPGPFEAVVRVKACGICGTDVHIVDGEFPPSPYPIVPGHEFSGEIVELGGQAPGDVGVGDRVGVDPSLFCGHCRACRIGRGNLCANWAAIGDTVNGAFAEYVAVPAVNCHRLPETVGFRQGALAEPLACAVHGMRRLGVFPGESLLVIGAGTMGLLLSQLLRIGGARVTVVERLPERRETARVLGAEVASDLDDLDDEAFEVVVDATGSPAAIEAGMERVRRGGRFLVFGVAPGRERVAVSPFRVYNDEITILGSMAVLHSYGTALELLAGGELVTEPLLTHTLPLERFPEALDLMRAGTGVKIQTLPFDTSREG